MFIESILGFSGIAVAGLAVLVHVLVVLAILAAVGYVTFTIGRCGYKKLSDSEAKFAECIFGPDCKPTKV